MKRETVAGERLRMVRRLGVPEQLEIPGTPKPTGPSRRVKRDGGEPARAKRRKQRAWPDHLMRSSD